MDNHAITLPPTALITTTGSTPLSCDQFYLPGLPIQLGTKTVLYQNSTVDPIDEELIDLHSPTHNRTKWDKLRYLPSHIQSIIDYIRSTTQPPEILFWRCFKTHSTLSFTIILIEIIILLISFQICYFRFTNLKNKSKRNVTLSIPSWKTPEQLQPPAPQQWL